MFGIWCKIFLSISKYFFCKPTKIFVIWYKVARLQTLPVLLKASTFYPRQRPQQPFIMLSCLLLSIVSVSFPDQHVPLFDLEKKETCWLSRWLQFSETLLWTCSTEDLAKKTPKQYALGFFKLFLLQLLYLLQCLLSTFHNNFILTVPSHTFLTQLYPKDFRELLDLMWWLP